MSEARTRKFDPFIPPTGPFRKTPAVHRGFLLRRLQGAHETVRRAAEYIEDQIQVRGSRFAISSRKLGAALGMSQSTGSRCLRKLRAMGLLSLWRKHSVRFDPVLQCWTGAAAVHEVVVTHPFGDDPGGVSHVPLPAAIGEP